MKVIPLDSKQKKRRKRRRAPRRSGKNTTMHSNVASPTMRLGAAKLPAFNRVRWLGVGVFLVILWGLYAFFNQPTFFVYDADITGNNILTHSEVFEASGIKDLSIFWVNAKDVRARLELLPGIKSADVSIALPARVKISVEERTPAVVWMVNNDPQWVDADGIFLDQKPSGIAPEMELTIQDLENRYITQVNPTLIRAAQRVHLQEPAINKLYYTHDVGLIYLTSEGWQVFLGEDDSNIGSKLRIAEAVRQDLLAQGITVQHIDVRNPLLVSYK